MYFNYDEDDEETSNFFLLFIDLFLVGLTIVSVCFNFIIQRDLNEDAVFHPFTQLNFHSYARMSQVALYIDAISAFMIICALIQVLKIFESFGWMIKIISKTI